MSAFASSSVIARESWWYGCVGTPGSMVVTRRRSTTAGTLPGAATQTRFAQPACSATLTTHGVGLISLADRISAMTTFAPAYLVADCLQTGRPEVVGPFQCVVR